MESGYAGPPCWTLRPQSEDMLGLGETERGGRSSARFPTLSSGSSRSPSVAAHLWRPTPSGAGGQRTNPTVFFAHQEPALVGGGLDGGGQRRGRGGRNGISGGGGRDGGQADLTQAGCCKFVLKSGGRWGRLNRGGISFRSGGTATDALSCKKTLLPEVVKRLEALRAAE